MNELILHLNRDPRQESRLGVAVSLARSPGGHITCLQSVAPPIRIREIMLGSVARELLRTSTIPLLLAH